MREKRRGKGNGRTKLPLTEIKKMEDGSGLVVGLGGWGDQKSSLEYVKFKVSSTQKGVEST